MLRRTLATCALLTAAACGDDVALTPDADGGPIECTTPRAQRLLPLAIGASWTYRVTPATGTPEDKLNTVEALEDVGGAKTGITAFRVRTEKLDGSTVSWQEDRCTSVTRHREQTFDLANVRKVDTIYTPDKIRVDETPAHTAMGASWVVSYTEVTTDSANQVTTIAKDESWSVDAVAESVTVPAGTFTAIKLHKVTSGAADKLYWFVPGVGKVKETGDQTEELVSFTLP